MEARSKQADKVFLRMTAFQFSSLQLEIRREYREDYMKLGKARWRNLYDWITRHLTK